jgi:GNAT superfamily N-acetyltransferase
MARLRRDMQAELMENDRGLDPDSVLEGNRDYFRRKLASGDFLAFLAEEGGQIVATSGMVVYEAPPTPGNPSGVEGYIMNMYTVPGARGRGLATRLVDALVEEARTLGARRTWLRASDAGKPVYERYGFHQYDRYMHFRILPSDG